MAATMPASPISSGNTEDILPEILMGSDVSIKVTLQ
jgi:hypothetical protein